MTSARTLCFIGLQVLLIVLSMILLGCYLHQLRRFEADVDAYDERVRAEATETEAEKEPILPKRERRVCQVT